MCTQEKLKKAEALGHQEEGRVKRGYRKNGGSSDKSQQIAYRGYDRRRGIRLSKKKRTLQKGPYEKKKKMKAKVRGGGRLRPRSRSGSLSNSTRSLGADHKQEKDAKLGDVEGSVDQ